MQEVRLNGQGNINVAMAVDSRNLEGVLVTTALGIKKEARKLGYSATTTKVDEIQKSRTNNMMAALEGKVAGLDISPPSAGPASSNKIRIRGQSAFAGADNSPLIVVNGLPMSRVQAMQMVAVAPMQTAATRVTTFCSLTPMISRA